MNRRGCRGGECSPFGFAFEDRGYGVRYGTGGKRRPCPLASRKGRSQTPRCPRACRPACRVPAPGSCTPRCRAARPTPVSIAGDVIVGDWVTLGDMAPGGSNALAKPKSSTFTVPSDRTLMLAGFRSR